MTVYFSAYFFTSTRIKKIKDKIKSGALNKDYKSTLQEMIQERKQRLSYKVEQYMTKGGQENFRASVFVDDVFIAYGQGSSKREAEQNSAQKALVKLTKSTD